MTIQFTDSEIYLIHQILSQRYEEDIDIQLSECALTVDGEDSRFHAVSWFVEDANFVIYKLGLFRFKPQYYYTPHEQFDSGTAEYDAIERCVIELLSNQSAHIREVSV